MAKFGKLVGEHRDRLGLSSSRVAELVGRAPGTVRSWERGRSVPDDPVVVSSLAAVLGIDEQELFVAAGLEPPGPATPFSLEETLSSIAPGSAETAPIDMPAVPEPPDATGRHARSVEESKLDDRDSALDKLRSAIESVSESISDARRSNDRTAPSTPSIPVQVQPDRTGRRPLSALSYMEDVEQRWSYRMRSILTGIGVAALGVVLLWAGSELLGAVGDVWDALTAGL